MRSTESVSSGQSNGKSLESITLYAAHMTRRMCQVLRWLMPILMCGAVVWLVTEHPSEMQHIRETITSGTTKTWDILLMRIVDWILTPVFVIAYSLWYSRLMEDVISSIEEDTETEEGSLLKRHLVGVALLSGTLLPISIFLPVPFSLLTYAGTIMLPSAAVILAYIGGRRRENPSYPVWQAVLTGIGLMIGTLLIALLLGQLTCGILEAGIAGILVR